VGRHNLSAKAASGSSLSRESRRGGQTWKDWEHGTRRSLGQAIQRSCDVYFYPLAWPIPAEQPCAAEWGQALWFGRMTGVDLPGETEKSLYRTRSGRGKEGRWKTGDEITSPSPRATEVTPLQMAVALSAIATEARCGSRTWA